jgi:serine/threonine protein phosphatase PrpC
MAENFFGLTDTGKMRDNNEDSFIAETILHDRYIAACVIDGVGGYEGGEIAAKLTQEAIVDQLQNPSEDIIQTLKEAFATANEKISKEKHSSGENGQMACVLTLALADIAGNKFYYAHVGDTRLYLFRDNSLVKVTRDHSFVGFLEDSGRLSEEAAMRHPKRNEINKALGFDDQQFLQPDYIETGESPFLPGDILLLCSDGLSDMIGNTTITTILTADKNLKEKARALVKAANDAGGKDNITVVLVQNDKLRSQHLATKPVAAKKNEATREEIAEVKESVTEIVPAKKRRRNGGVIALSILSLILLGALSWFIYNDYFKKENSDHVSADKAVQVRNQDEQRLTDSINKTTAKEIFLNHIFQAQSILVSDSILFEKDSLYLHGGGLTLISDSAYRGPALVLTANCKYILIDSLTLENFNIGAIVKNKALHLKDVRFKNCSIAIQHEIDLPGDRKINGSITDSLFFKPDSIKINR